MNRIKFAAAIAMAVGCTVALSAQAVSGDKDKAAQTGMSSPVTVTGCIAKGHEAGHYVLTNAVLTPETAPSAAGATSASTIDKTASIPAGTSYALKGDMLEGHVGHKVEVTGTTWQEKATSTTDIANSKDTSNPTSAGSTSPQATLDVKTVKMLSTTCS
jgi:hypothetical protein